MKKASEPFKKSDPPASTAASLFPTSSQSSDFMDPTPSHIPRMTGPSHCVGPSSTAAGPGMHLPDPGLESEVLLPPRSAPTSSMSALFDSFVHFLGSQKPATLGAPPSTPSTPPPPPPPPPPVTVSAGGGGGVFGSGLHSLPHALRAVGACEVAGPHRQDHRPCTFGESPCAFIHPSRGGSI